MIKGQLLYIDKNRKSVGQDLFRITKKSFYSFSALPNGGKCFQEGSCEDPNAECNLESKTCECLDKFFLFGEESICLPCMLV